MKNAKYFKHLQFNSIQCTLCPRMCLIHQNELGFCKVRKNHYNSLKTFTYGAIAGLKIDKLSAQGIRDFLPNSKTLAIGTFGCNMDCECCRREFMVKDEPPTNNIDKIISAKEIVDIALHFECKSIIFTFSEPTLFIEYAIDIAEIAHKNGLKICLFSNGYINDDPRIEFYAHIDCAVFDLKALSSNFYQHRCMSSIEPVLRSIKYFYSLKKPLELNTLIIPQLNDNELEFLRMLNWIKDNLSVNIPLHIESFYPSHVESSIEYVNNSTIYNLSRIAINNGFDKVYSEYL